METQEKKYFVYLPIIISISIIAGILIGTRFSLGNDISIPLFHSAKKTDKINDVLNYIDEYYVDTVNRSQLSDVAIDALLQSLDPHSYYIPAKELNGVNEELQGNFEGIGIEFNIQKDTIIVVSLISGGPSEMAGIMAGDRIVKVDNKNVAGIKISNKEVFKRLRGKGGTQVKVSIYRKGLPRLLDFNLTRAKIPEISVDAAYVIKKGIGYIKVSKFAANTFEEFHEAIKNLKAEGVTKLIFDLRGNGGGFLDAAVNMADEFLEKNKVIVYTKGKSKPKTYYKATSKGELENTKLIVLIDEWSASASEIVAGAIQDNDRGLIVGRRSFGKGLVQNQVELPDGSALRLTIARYYTPTGRCIQKPYNEGVSEYYHNFMKRFEDGETLSADSIHFADSLKFKTPKGKTVYGGGGIMPDIFVPIDTSGSSRYLSEISSKNLVNQFAFDYVDKNRKTLKLYKDVDDFKNKFFISSELFESFITFAEKNGVKRNDAQIARSRKIFNVQLKALMGRNLFRNTGFYPIIQEIDETLLKAIELISKN